ncbi:MAG: uroporphyrinogen-III synthase [Proteobacteria bacterium]|nr:uroporphyrinogen-III synthase [Pseudomonadota bacterium]
MRVIVTRPAPQAAEWSARLVAAGVAAVALPLIDIAEPADPLAVRTAWLDIAACRLAVFVSPNAVQRFFAARPAGSAWPAALRAGGPGPGTADALVAAGVPRGLVVAPSPDARHFDSEALWQGLRADDWHGARVLIVRGDGGRAWLGDTLAAHGAEVRYLSAYRRITPALDAAATALLDAAVAEPARHVWLFGSSEAAERLRALRPAAVGMATRAIATHPQIAARLQALGFGDVHETGPAFDAVVACIQSLRP